PSALQAPGNGAILAGPVPPGAVKVSLDPNDYPPADSPGPAIAASLNRVGRCVPSSGFAVDGSEPTAICVAGPAGQNVSNRELVTQDGVRYKAHVSVGLMGKTIWFEPVQ